MALGWALLFLGVGSSGAASPLQEPGGARGNSALHDVLRATREPGWSSSSLDLEAWADLLDAGEVADVLGFERVPEAHDLPRQTLSEPQRDLLLDACAARPALGRQVGAHLPSGATALGSFLIEVASGDLTGALERLEVVRSGAGRTVRDGLGRVLRSVPILESRPRLELQLRTLSGEPALWLVQAIGDRGSTADAELLLRALAEGRQAAKVVVPALLRCARPLDELLDEAGAASLQELARRGTAVERRVALAGLQFLRAPEGRALAREMLLSPVPAEVRAAHEWCRAMGAPTHGDNLELWAEREDRWLARREEVRWLLESHEASQQLAGLALIEGRAWHQEAWGELLAASCEPADPRVARRLLDALDRLGARARVPVAQRMLRRGRSSLAPRAEEVLRSAGVPEELWQMPS